MSLSAFEIKLVLAELGPLVEGGVVRAAWCADRRTLVLEMRVQGDNRFVSLSAASGETRLHLVTRKPRQPPEPPAFVMLARKHLTGARLVRTGQLDGDRVVRLDFEALERNEDGTPAGIREVSLIAELMGRQAALVLVADHTVLGALTSGGRHTEARHAVHGEYRRPEARTSAHAPSKSDPHGLEAMEADGSRSAAIDTFYRERAAAKARDDAFRKVQTRLRREKKAASRQLEAVERDRVKAARADTYRARAQLLMGAYGQQVPRGAESIAVVDYAAEGMPEVAVPIDPSLDLQGNIDKNFALARKGDRAVGHIERRHQLAATKLAVAEHALGQIAHLMDAGGSATALDVLVDELGLAPRQERPTAQSKASKGPQKAEPFRRFVSRSGLEILVGKGGRDNDTLSLKIARGNDLWLHARDWAGAHVVVRAVRGQQPDQETILDAATLAVHYSKARGGSGIEVLTTAAKNVRKPKGLPPGRVTVAGGKTIAIRHDQGRIERLFG